MAFKHDALQNIFPANQYGVHKYYRQFEHDHDSAPSFPETIDKAQNKLNEHIRKQKPRILRTI